MWLVKPGGHEWEGLRTVSNRGTWAKVKAVMDRPGVEIYHVSLTMRAHKEGDQWAAYCEELGAHSCGDTLDEALANVMEATLVYLNTLEALGERRRLFDERGIVPRLGYPELHEEVDRPVRADEYVTRIHAGTSELVG